MKDAAGTLGIVLAVLLVFMASSGSTSAGIGKGNGEIGFDVGVTSFDDHMTDATGARFGIRGGYFISNLFQIEFESSASWEKSGSSDVFLQTFFVNGVFNFHPGKRTVPYLRVGVGSARKQRSSDSWLYRGNVSDGSAALQLAFGSRFFIGKATALRVDLSYLDEVTFDEGAGHVSLVVGLTWRLGKEK